jgi:cytidylate kinase
MARLADERLTRFVADSQELTRLAEERMVRFENEMREFKNEMRQSKRELDKKWGDLANKMGTIIEDILAPNLRRLAREHFHFDSILDFMMRRSRRRPDNVLVESEFDTIVARLTELGIYAMRMGEDAMELASAAALED